MNPSKINILLSNDDGIDSPGLWVAAESLSELGYVTVAAPRDHMSSTGRGYQRNSDGIITKKQLTIHGQNWDVYAVGGSPSQSVTHGILELVPNKPDLVVSGINYGENLGTDVTWSGTVGAAIEAATLGIPALSISQQIFYKTWDRDPMSINFNPCAYFTKFFAKLILEKHIPEDVHVLNVVVPADATPETPWKVTQLSDMRYFTPYVEREGSIEEKSRIRTHLLETVDIIPGNDIYAVRIEKVVSVTPLSINLTSRTNLKDFEELLRSEN